MLFMWKEVLVYMISVSSHKLGKCTLIQKSLRKSNLDVYFHHYLKENFQFLLSCSSSELQTMGFFASAILPKHQLHMWGQTLCIRTHLSLHVWRQLPRPSEEGIHEWHPHQLSSLQISAPEKVHWSWPLDNYSAHGFWGIRSPGFSSRHHSSGLWK